MDNIREYVEIFPDAELIHLSSSHRKHDRDSEEYMHANLLQLADMLLGCVIYACFNEILGENLYPKIGDRIRKKKELLLIL